MSDAVIQVENLGKRYRIKHQAERQSYTALRDVIADRLKGLFRSRHSSPAARPSTEDFWALKDVSFEIKQGEVLGIIGRNGAGKSTLLKILSRITEPTEGRVRVRGRVASLLEVGTGFHPELTGRENVFLNGAILGMNRVEIKRKFAEIVAFAEIDKFLDTPVKRYSSGMYVRLAFAVAAHLDSEILIMDEVLAVGDAQFQKKCLGKLGDVAHDGRTVLLVSHNLSTVRSFCIRGIFLQNGKIAVSGSIGNVLAAYSMDGICSGTRTYSDSSLVRRVSVSQTKNGIVLEVEYSQISRQLALPGFGFIIHDADGRPILGHNPMLESRTLQGPWPDSGVVRATVDEPKLLDGTYSVSVFLGDEHVTAFTDPNCLFFSVSGMVTARQLPPERVGSVYPRCTYEFDSLEDADRRS